MTAGITGRDTPRRNGPAAHDVRFGPVSVTCNGCPVWRKSFTDKSAAFLARIEADHHDGSLPPGLAVHAAEASADIAERYSRISALSNSHARDVLRFLAGWSGPAVDTAMAAVAEGAVCRCGEQLARCPECAYFPGSDQVAGWRHDGGDMGHRCADGSVAQPALTTASAGETP